MLIGETPRQSDFFMIKCECYTQQSGTSYILVVNCVGESLTYMYMLVWSSIRFQVHYILYLCGFLVIRVKWTTPQKSWLPFQNNFLLDALWKSLPAFFSQITDTCIFYGIWVIRGHRDHTQNNRLIYFGLILKIYIGISNFVQISVQTSCCVHNKLYVPVLKCINK